MNRQLLESEFSPDQIRQRNGNFGKTLDYIEGHSVIQRLNEAFEGSWSFEIISHDILDEEVVVLGKLSADGVLKTQFGSSAITRAKDDGGIVSLADDLKAAATDSLKKCATLLGVGLYLYSSSRSVSGDVEITKKNDPRQQARYAKQDNARISNKQLNYLVDLGKKIGLDSKGLDKRSLDEFGVKMAFLNRKDASAFIDSLKQKAA